MRRLALLSFFQARRLWSDVSFNNVYVSGVSYDVSKAQLLILRDVPLVVLISYVSNVELQIVGPSIISAMPLLESGVCDCTPQTVGYQTIGFSAMTALPDPKFIVCDCRVPDGMVPDCRLQNRQP